MVAPISDERHRIGQQRDSQVHAEPQDSILLGTASLSSGNSFATVAASSLNCSASTVVMFRCLSFVLVRCFLERLLDSSSLNLKDLKWADSHLAALRETWKRTTVVERFHRRFSSPIWTYLKLSPAPKSVRRTDDLDRHEQNRRGDKEPLAVPLGQMADVVGTDGDEVVVNAE